jgi:hypothetical protein
MFMHVKGKFIRQLIQLILLGILSVFQSVAANLLDPPVITLSSTDCNKAYMVQIFEDGRVEYRGGFGVKVRDWRYTHIARELVAALLKKFDDLDLAALEDREDLPGNGLREHGLTAIRLNDGNRQFTSFGGKNGTPLYLGIMSIDELRNNHKNLDLTFALLQLEIIRITNLQQWVSDPTLSVCRNRYSISISDLKINQ